MHYVNFDGKSAGLLRDPVFGLCIKFGANICNNGRFMAKNIIFNMAAAAILNLAEYQFCQ